MRFTINSRKYGPVEFSRPGSGHIFVDLNGQPGTLGKQICHGGGLTGSTMSYHGDDQDCFESTCRSWWTAFLRNERLCI